METAYAHFSTKVDPNVDPLTYYDTMTNEKLRAIEVSQAEKKSSKIRYVGPLISWVLLAQSCVLTALCFRGNSWSENTSPSLVTATKVALLAFIAISACTTFYFCKTRFCSKSSLWEKICCRHPKTESLTPTPFYILTPPSTSAANTSSLSSMPPSPLTPLVKEQDPSDSLSPGCVYSAHDSPQSMPSRMQPKGNSSHASPQSLTARLQPISDETSPRSIPS